MDRKTLGLADFANPGFFYDLYPSHPRPAKRFSHPNESQVQSMPCRPLTAALGELERFEYRSKESLGARFSLLLASESGVGENEQNGGTPALFGAERKLQGGLSLDAASQELVQTGGLGLSGRAPRPE